MSKLVFGTKRNKPNKTKAKLIWKAWPWTKRKKSKLERTNPFCFVHRLIGDSSFLSDAAIMRAKQEAAMARKAAEQQQQQQSGKKWYTYMRTLYTKTLDTLYLFSDGVLLVINTSLFIFFSSFACNMDSRRTKKFLFCWKKLLFGIGMLFGFLLSGIWKAQHNQALFLCVLFLFHIQVAGRQALITQASFRRTSKSRIAKGLLSKTVFLCHLTCHVGNAEWKSE